MKPLFTKVSGLVCVVLALGSVTSRAVDLQTLVDRSPFAPTPQAGDASGSSEPQGTLEFRGMVTDAAGTSYSIFDTTTNKGRWVRAEDSNSPVQVKNFDAASNTLEIEQNGKPVKLPLKRAVIQAGQPITAMVAPAPSPNGPPQGVPAPGQGGPQAKPDAAADARRLEAVAAEVRRRRALRNTANGTRQGQPAAPAAAPAAPVAAPPQPAP